MESTCQESLDSTGVSEVGVVLATFNGAKYIREQLDSLIDQSGVTINLYVSDDGSTDQTKQIISEYCEAFSKVTFLEGPRKGPAANFFFLLVHTTEKYVAFADQDDIWDSRHLVNSINDLSVFEGIPTLRFSATRQFSEGSKTTIWPKNTKLPKLQQLLLQNPARGCSMVLNKDAVLRINLYQPNFAVMHDWWILLQIFISGKVIYSSVPEVNYRLHNSNFMGIPKKSRFKNFKNQRTKLYAIIWQAQELLEINREILSGTSMDTITLVADFESLDFFQKIKRILLNKNRFRYRVFEDLLLRIFLVIVRPLKDSKVSRN